MKKASCYLFLLMLCTLALGALRPACAQNQPQSAALIPRDRVSLVLSGENPKHAQQCLSHLLWLKKNRKVQVGNILILGLNVYASPEEVPPEAIGRLERLNGQAPHNPRASYVPPPNGFSQQLLAKLVVEAGVPRQSMFDSRQVYERYNINYSPTWIVRHRGQDYVLEGYTDLSSFFNAEGEFVRESW